MTDNIAGLAVMVTAFYLFTIVVLYYWNAKHPLPPCDEYIHSGRSVLELVYPRANLVLRVSRALMFIWWFGVGWVLKFSLDAPHPRFYMFTMWNIILMSFYFLFASICSWQYAISPKNEDTNFPSWWSKSRRITLSHIVRVMHSVIGGCALFITIVAWLGKTGFWSVQQHLTNTLFFLIEGAQTGYVSRLVHFSWSASWLYVYMCFVWIIVHAMGEYNWPYPFMQTDASQTAAYGSYFGVLVCNVATFLVWKYIKVGYVKLYSRFYGKDVILNADETEAPTKDSLLENAM